MAIARQVAANAPLSVQAAKELIIGASTSTTRTCTPDPPHVPGVARIEDAIEGPRAFVEKRRPAGPGR